MALRTAIAAIAATLVLGNAAQAADIVFTPASGGFGGGVTETPWLGPVPTGGYLGAHYIDFGVDFGFGANEVYINDTDPPAAPMYSFAGATDGFHDFWAPVDGRIVALDGQHYGATNFISIYGGASYSGLLQLSAFNLHGDLLGAAVNTCPDTQEANWYGCFAQLTIQAPGIATFRVESLTDEFGPDSFGVREISLNTPTALIPEPGPWALLIVGFGAAGAMLRSRRRRVVA